MIHSIFDKIPTSVFFAVSVIVIGLFMHVNDITDADWGLFFMVLGFVMLLLTTLMTLSDRKNKLKILIGICHECLREFKLKDEYLIDVQTNYKIWECPHCDYPNSSEDCMT